MESQGVDERNTGGIEGIAYTHGYCDELNPLRIALPLLRTGVAPPVVRHACELGFGHGVSLNLHAAGSGVRWFGADFNPEHVRFAEQLAGRAGSGAVLSAQDFEQFCRRDDLPNFDFIGLHGVWSWISEASRARLAEFFARRLADGGVVCLSYNTLPGWAPMLPVREVLHTHFRAGAAAAGEAEALARIAEATGFMRTLMATRPGYAVVNPLVAERVETLAREDAHYLAHEYFNPDWQPQAFSQVAATLDACGLRYAGSADYRDHADALHLNPAQRALLADLGDPTLRETVRDFATNRAMRRDYWIKGGPTLDATQRQAALRERRVMLALPREAVRLTIRGALGDTALPARVYAPILDALADHRPATLGELEARLAEAGGARPGLDDIVEAVMLLIGTGALLNVQDDAAIAAARPMAARLNTAICERACGHDDLHFLASPVTGSGVAMPRVAQLFLLARGRGLDAPAQWAALAGEALPGEPADALLARARRFASDYLGILGALGIA